MRETAMKNCECECELWMECLECLFQSPVLIDNEIYCNLIIQEEKLSLNSSHTQTSYAILNLLQIDLQEK